MKKLKEKIELLIKNFEDYWNNLNKQNQIILAILILILPSFCFVKFFYLPKRESIIQMERQVQKLEQEINKLKTLKIKLLKMQKDEKKLNEILTKALNLLPKKTEIATLLNNIAEEKQKFSIEIINFEAKEEIKKDNFYAIIPLHFLIKGDFNNIMLFIDNLRFKKRIFVPNKITFTKEKDKVKANCEVFTYRLISEQNQKKKAGRKK